MHKPWVYFLMKFYICIHPCTLLPSRHGTFLAPAGLFRVSVKMNSPSLNYQWVERWPLSTDLTEQVIILKLQGVLRYSEGCLSWLCGCVRRLRDLDVSGCCSVMFHPSVSLVTGFLLRSQSLLPCGLDISFVFFWLSCGACGILVPPNQGSKPDPQQWQ